MGLATADRNMVAQSGLRARRHDAAQPTARSQKMFAGHSRELPCAGSTFQCIGEAAILAEDLSHGPYATLWTVAKLTEATASASVPAGAGQGTVEPVAALSLVHARFQISEETRPPSDVAADHAAQFSHRRGPWRQPSGTRHASLQ
jgi:hypothetical protein